MRRLVLAVAFAALAAAGGAQAFPWPLKPFHSQHPIGGNFGDPRMTFLRTLAQNGLDGPGVFTFHNGIDIHAAPGTPVYPIFSGTVRLLNGTAVAVQAPGHPTFQYFHLKLAVHSGQHVVRLRTVLGWITPWARHVHLSEIANGRALNPLAPGRISPYSDGTRPRVREVVFRDTRGEPQSPLGLQGRIDIFADAYDLPVPFPGFQFGLPIAPAALSWRLTTSSGRVVRPETTPVDFRKSLPPNGQFWRVYGRGTYPNGPVFGGQLYKRMPGHYLFRMTPDGLDTTRLADGTYVVTVTARDVRGNRGSLSERFDVLNHPSGQPKAPLAVPPKDARATPVRLSATTGRHRWPRNGPSR
ncbi:MAG: M23 family metallopeptidase [Gaiellaceae bacterium]